MVASIGNGNLANISRNDVKARVKELDRDVPSWWGYDSSDYESATLNAAARNNIMLDKILANQEIIINNQNKILNNQGKNLDTMA